jgi:hypothetical protein
MRMRGLEPPRGYPHTDLNRARLPIPPHPRAAGIVAGPVFHHPLWIFESSCGALEFPVDTCLTRGRDV